MLWSVKKSWSGSAGQLVCWGAGTGLAPVKQSKPDRGLGVIHRPLDFFFPTPSELF